VNCVFTVGLRTTLMYYDVHRLYETKTVQETGLLNSNRASRTGVYSAPRPAVKHEKR
jgi:hypothetical protein